MKLTKRIYKRSEVDRLLKVNEYNNNQNLDKYKERIEELSFQCERLEKEINYYKNKENLIISVLENATKKADEIVNSAKLLYQIECERLKNFSAKLDDYCKKELKAPPEKKIKNIKTVNKKIKDVVKSDFSSKEKIDLAEKVINGKSVSIKPLKSQSKANKETFNPLEIIKQYIVATQSEKGGFDINEILNPTDTNLEEICKEMGLMAKK